MWKEKGERRNEITKKKVPPSLGQQVDPTSVDFLGRLRESIRQQTADRPRTPDPTIHPFLLSRVHPSFSLSFILHSSSFGQLPPFIFIPTLFPSPTRTSITSK